MPTHAIPASSQAFHHLRISPNGRSWVMFRQIWTFGLAIGLSPFGPRTRGTASSDAIHRQTHGARLKLVILRKRTPSSGSGCYGLHPTSFSPVAGAAPPFGLRLSDPFPSALPRRPVTLP